MLGQSGTEDYGENNNIIGMDFCSGVERQTKKRRFETTPENVTSSLMSGRQFVLLCRNSSTFVTTEWKETGSSLFLPLKADTFVNLQKYEQITVNDGNFFIADESGNYSRSVKAKGYQYGDWTGHDHKPCLAKMHHPWCDITDIYTIAVQEVDKAIKSLRNYSKVLHLWKYCTTARQFFVAESFLFTSPQDFSVVLNHLYTN